MGEGIVFENVSYESIDESECVGMKPSASYDYTPLNNVQKAKDDLDFIVNGKVGNPAS